MQTYPDPDPDLEAVLGGGGVPGAGQAPPLGALMTRDAALLP